MAPVLDILYIIWSDLREPLTKSEWPCMPVQMTFARVPMSVGDLAIVDLDGRVVVNV